MTTLISCEKKSYSNIYTIIKSIKNKNKNKYNEKKHTRKSYLNVVANKAENRKNKIHKIC